MLIGLYMPTSGSIKYNDILLSDIDVHHLRSELVAFSEQEPMLLSDTLENNLLAGHAIGNRDMFFYWLNRLDMGAFINAFSEGVNRFIDSTVDNVSGGEKQKLSQIRTFLKDAPVIILDEPTSSLDDLSISRLKDVLLDLKGDKIIITITHHAFFQSIADEIIDIRECVC
jgi:ATP-binding cassette subfamily C protein